ncbi:hypothetical protein KCV07_g286, partial [Aureobasidium melanogenum]
MHPRRHNLGGCRRSAEVWPKSKTCEGRLITCLLLNRFLLIVKSSSPLNSVIRRPSETGSLDVMSKERSAFGGSSLPPQSVLFGTR